MSIWRRFRLFFIGVGLGSLMVYVMFGDRDLTTWTPQSRVIAAIDSAEVSIDDRANCQLECLGFTIEKVDRLTKKADVDFGNSNVKHEPCPIYRLKTKDEGKAVEMIWEVCERANTAKLMGITKVGVDCACS